MQKIPTIKKTTRIKKRCSNSQQLKKIHNNKKESQYLKPKKN